MSTVFMGRTKAYQQKLEEEYKIPFGKLMPEMGFVLMGGFCGLHTSTLEEKCREIIAAFPELHIGYSLSANVVAKQDLAASWKLIEQAHEIAGKYPEQNSKILWLLPTKNTDFMDTKRRPSETTEVEKGQVWNYAAAVPLPGDMFVWNQASIVKKQDGKLIIINPTHFDERAVKWIESLGPVDSLVTTTAAHGYALKMAAEVWPAAKLFGTNPDNCHDRPELKWNFLNDEKQEFEGLVHMRLQGNMFNETVFYHASSKSLFGFTDTLIDNTPDADWNLRIYLFGLGVFPEQGVQGYFFPATTDWWAFRRSLEKLRQWDIQHMFLGHGGDYHGQQVQQRLNASFSWALEPSTFPSWFERRVYLPLKWLRSLNLARPFVHQKIGDLAKKKV